jgi:hypothetical protein
MTGFDYFFTKNGTVDLLERVAETICADYVVSNSTVCHGAVKEMGDIILPVLAESLLSPDYFCSEFLGVCSNSSYYVFYAEQFVDDLLKTKPAEI